LRHFRHTASAAEAARQPFRHAGCNRDSLQATRKLAGFVPISLAWKDSPGVLRNADIATQGPATVHDPRLASVLQAAAGRIQAAIAAAVDKAAVQLAPLALSATSGTVRMELMSAERELRTKSGRILQGFQKNFHEQSAKSLNPKSVTPHSGHGDLDWDALSLVGDDEVERGVMADRLGQTLLPDCDEHLKVIYAQFSSLMGEEHVVERNPLRPQAVATALLSGLADAECPQDTIQTLTTHIGRLLGTELNAAYGILVQEMRQQGIEPRGMVLARPRTSGGSSHAPFSTSTSESTEFTSTSGQPLPSQAGGFQAAQGMAGAPAFAQIEAQHRAAQALSNMFGVALPTSPAGLEGAFLPVPGGQGALSQAAAQAARADFQHLLRKLAVQAMPLQAAGDGFTPGGADTAPMGLIDPQGTPGMADGTFAGPMMAVNLIRAHRDELVRASGGAAIDQIVIDIVAALFDQVLSAPKVAPEMARQIARLQMPVLRVALGDISFFSSRKHPVRRFVNRIATLSGTIDEQDASACQSCLSRVTQLVDTIVEGDFDNPALYESKLAELEAFIEQTTSRDAAEQAAVAELLHSKEADLRVQQRYMQILKRELTDVEIPEFLRDFLTQIWSQVQVMAAARHGADSAMAQRMKKAGHDLALSVQPKGQPQLRKSFLLGLPQLMRDLNDGLGMIQWPEEAKQAFFAQLLPAHAECLKAAPHHELTQRMLEQRLTKVENLAIPSREEAANDPLPSPLADLAAAPTLTVVSAFSAEEAKAAGFVAEAAISADAPLDIDLDTPADPSLAELDINLDAPPTPSAGMQLMHHIQKGTAYQMLTQDQQWKKVRLTWVSEGRTFFIFTHGHTHKQTISLTARTLAKMCESGRFKAFEQSELIERATLRARRQLAALSTNGRERSAA